MSNLIDQITAAYEREQHQSLQKVTRANELPTSYEAITDEWLTAVLCVKQPGAQVVSHTRSAVDNGTSNRCGIQVSYNDAGRKVGLPERLFCKATHGLSNRIVFGLSGMAFGEVTFYNAIRGLLNIEAPRSCFAKVDMHSFNSLVMLIDLTAEGTEFCSHHTRMTRQRTERQLQLLAEMHGKGYSDPLVQSQISQYSTWPEWFGNTLGYGMKEGSEQGFLRAEEFIPTWLYRRHQEIWPATLKSVEQHRQLPLTLAHGDAHLKNWYITGNGEMGLSDWQCAHRGHWGRDIAYAISTALTVEERRQWERDLLRFYLDRLQKAGGPAISFDECWKHYRQQLITALTWWTITLNPAPDMPPDMQPRDAALEFVHRITTAMDDVATLDSFE